MIGAPIATSSTTCSIVAAELPFIGYRAQESRPDSRTTCSTLIELVFDAGYLSLDKMIGGMPGLGRKTKRCVADALAPCAFAASMGGRSGMRSSKRDKDEVRAYVEHHAHEQAGTTG